MNRAMIRKVALLLCLLIALGASAGVLSAGAAGGLSTGDYVVFGSYNGAPILWRVINTDSNGALLFSEKILTLKAFDAAEKTEDVPVDYPNVGNNYWPSSNIRQWLSSSDQTIAYSANAPVYAYVEGGYNAYADEPGFLYEFTAPQRAMIKKVTQKSLLDLQTYKNANKGGSELYTYDRSFENMLTNYDKAYFMEVEDTVFLLDTKQLHDYVYARGYATPKYPTEAAVTFSDYKSSILSAEKPWKYWLRTPRAEDNSSPRVNYFGNIVSDDTSWNGTVGVAPALYIDLNAALAGGNGSAASPYVVAGGKGSFNDLAGFDHSSDAIYALASRGIVNGYEDGSFKPGDHVTRADFVLMLIRALGHTGGATSNFPDVAEGAYYYNAVGQAKLRLYVGGDENGNFNPGALVTMQDMYLIAARALSAKNGETVRYREGALDSCLDAVSISSYAVDSLSWLLDKGVIKLYDGRLYPLEKATRADCARLIFSMLGYID